MIERRNEDDRRGDIQASQAVESAWQKLTFPDRYDAREVNFASNLIETLRDNIEHAYYVYLDEDHIYYQKLMLGVLHYPDFELPHDPYAEITGHGTFLGIIFFN